MTLALVINPRIKLLTDDPVKYETAFTELYGKIPKWVPCGTKEVTDKNVVREVRMWVRNYP